MRKSVGLIQPTCGHHHFKAAFLECPQRLKPIYFPVDFTVITVAPDFMYLPTGPSPGDGFGRFCLHSERAVGSVTAAGGLPTHYSFLPLSGPRASPAHTYQQGSQGGWAGPALNCHLFRDNKDRLPQPLSQDAGNRASTFYVFNKFSNTLVSVAAFMGIISLGSWPPNTLFIVD